MKAGSDIRSDAGFTLIEVMVAGLLATLIGLPCFMLLRSTMSTLDIVGTRALQSEQARETFRLLADGTASIFQATDKRGFAMVEGLHSRSIIPGGTWPLRSTSAPGQFIMMDDTLQVSGDTLGPVTIACQTAGSPIPDCTGTESRTVKGWLGSDPVLAQKNANAIQFPITVSIAVTNPYRAARSVASAFGITQSLGITETFRNQFDNLVEAAP